MDFLKSYWIRKTAFLWSLELYENYLLLQRHQKTAYDLNKSQIFHWKAQQFSHNSFHAYLPHAHIQFLCTQLWDTHLHTHTYSQLIHRGAHTDTCKTHFESIINDSTREANKRELNSVKCFFLSSDAYYQTQFISCQITPLSGQTSSFYIALCPSDKHGNLLQSPLSSHHIRDCQTI